MPLQFYIGELGATRYGAGCFNVATARYVAAIRTHGYWGLCGPKSRPARLRDAAAFGQSQAVAAIRAWNNNPDVAGRTLFADVEAGFGGWGAPLSPAENVALLDGFLLTIASAGFVPGVYINESDKMTWFPPDYTAAAPFVYWVAGGPLSGTMPGPCHSGDTMAPVRAAWSRAVGQETFGGMKAVIWQYWLSPLGCVGDFNYSPQSGRARFAPQPA